MSISGELRGLREPSGHERHDARAANANDKEVINRIELMFMERRWTSVGTGRSADVTMLDIWSGTDTTPWVIKQEVRRTREQRLLNTSLEAEMTMHDAAYAAIEAARATHPDTPYARIPKPLSHLWDSKRQWLLMDYVPGDNLFVHTLRTHLLTFENEPEERTAIQKMNKDELLECITSDTYINTLPARLIQELSDGTVDEITEEHWRILALGVNRNTRGPSKVLTARQHEALTNTVAALHAAGIHHRDLHPGNIHILPDGSVSILDFGLSTVTGKGVASDNGIYLVDVGNEFDDTKVRLLSDDECLKGYWDVARKIA